MTKKSMPFKKILIGVFSLISNEFIDLNSVFRLLIKLYLTLTKTK